jgi:protein phosphatase PTC2/3
MDKLLKSDKGKQEVKKYMEEQHIISEMNGGFHMSEGMKKKGSGAGCTATVALITSDEIYCANAGDSRTVMCENGQHVELSQDHRPDNQDERSRIFKAGGEIERGRINGVLSLSRAIGDLGYKKTEAPKDASSEWYLNNHMVTSFPDVVMKPFHKDVEFLVLACDGIWDCMHSDEVVSYFKGELDRCGSSVKDIPTANHKLLEDICPPTMEDMKRNDGEGTDNMSIIIVDFIQNTGRVGK